MSGDTVGQAVLLASRHPCRLRAPAPAGCGSRQDCRLASKTACPTSSRLLKDRPASARVPRRQAEKLRHNNTRGADTPVCRIETRLDTLFPQLAARCPLAVTF